MSGPASRVVPDNSEQRRNPGQDRLQETIQVPIRAEENAACRRRPCLPVSGDRRQRSAGESGVSRRARRALFDGLHRQVHAEVRRPDGIRRPTARGSVVPPLEALWWAEDVGAFHANKRDEWQWTMMIMQPEQVMQSDLAPALDQIGKKEQEVAIPRPATPCHSGGGARRPSDARRTLQ